MIKYKTAKSVLAQYAASGGLCDTAPPVDLFVRKVLEYLLISGAYGNERKFCFHACDGCFTLPRELEVPLKIKIDGRVGSVWNRWFEYHSGNDIEDPCLSADAFYEEPNYYPTVYDPQPCGQYIAILAHCNESTDSYVVVKGEDATGRPIVTVHNGEQIIGERLTPIKDKTVRTTAKFAKVTEISKSKTNGYITLYALYDDCLLRSFLADYAPYEESPAYRRVQIRSKCPPICKITVLGRIRLKEYYADDDIIPFDNLLALQVAGQTINNMTNNNLEISVTQSKFMQSLIETEGNYKKVNNGQPLEVFRPLSGGSVQGARAAGRSLRRRYR